MTLLQEKLWRLQNDWQKEELTDFTASSRWLEKLKQIYRAREKKIVWRSR